MLSVIPAITPETESMKLTDFTGWLISSLEDRQTTATELLRALREQSSHFDEAKAGLLDEIKPELSEEARAALVRWLTTDVSPAALRGKTGPRGGLEADPFRAAFVLLAVMVNGLRSDVGTRVWSAWHINHEGSILTGWGEDWEPTIATCELTGEHLFGEALKQILSNQIFAGRVRLVRVRSDSKRAEIHFDDGVGHKVSVFDMGIEPVPHLARTAELSGTMVAIICARLKGS